MKNKSGKSSLKQAGLFGLAAGIAAVGMAIFIKKNRDRRAAGWRQHMESPAPRTALVTGASSGIGQAYARRLASQGYNVVLVARREQRLNELAEEFRQQYGVKPEVIVADLSTSGGIAKVEERMIAGGDIDFLVNNAGYAIFADFADTPIEGHLGIINCHALASVRFCRAALPGMLARDRGAIVNVSSIGAFIPKSKDVTYCAAKAYLNTFSEALHIEVRNTRVRVQSLVPGFTMTEFHDHPQYAEFEIKKRVPAWLWMTADEVVSASLRALGENRVVCVPGLKNRLLVAAGRSGLASALLGTFARLFPEAAAQPLKRTSLDLLACPTCRGELDLQGSLTSGKLACQQCSRTYPIVKGIPQFIQYEELSGFNRRFAALYDWFSYVYRAFSKLAFAFIGTTEDHARREVLSRLDPRGGRVLEVSVGPGVNLPYLVGAPEVGEVCGLDISAGQLRHCRSFAKARGWEVDLFQGNAEELPFKDNSFESVFHIGGINFFNDKKKAIAEMIRVAKPGARIVICDETERGARGYELTLPGFKRSFKDRRDVIVPPVDLVPGEMEEVRLTDVWKGWMYCLEFKKPGELSPALEARKQGKLNLSALSTVAQTLVIPLHYRAMESLLPDPLVDDRVAGRILNQLGVELPHLGKRSFQHTATMLRARLFDRQARAFLAQHDQAIVVEIGCGLDARFQRVDNGRVEWYNLDLPEVIALQKQCFTENPRRHSIAHSVFDLDWMDCLPPVGPYLFLAEGVFPYFPEDEVRRVVAALGARFPGAEIVMDALSPFMVRLSKVLPSMRGFQARPRWALVNSNQVEAWGQGIRLLHDWIYLIRSEPRLKSYRWMVRIPVIRDSAHVLHLKLGEAAQEV